MEPSVHPVVPFHTYVAFLHFVFANCLGSDAWFLPFVTQQKGHGACCFRRYMDDTQAIDTLNHGLREGGELGFEHSKKRKFESLTMDNLQHPSSFVSAITEPVEEAFIERVQNDSTSGMSTLQDMVPEEAVSLDHVIEKALQVSSLKSQAIHHRQAEFWRQISAAGDASIAGAFLYLYSCYLHILAFYFYDN